MSATITLERFYGELERYFTSELQESERSGPSGRHKADAEKRIIAALEGIRRESARLDESKREKRKVEISHSMTTPISIVRAVE